MLTEKSQLLVRWDKFEPDSGESSPDFFVFGYNLWPTQPTELQVNYVIPTRGDFGDQRVLVNAQVAF